MHIAPELGDSAYKITGFNEQSIHINNEAYHQPLLLSPNQLIYPWEVTDVASLTLAQLEPALALKPQLILFGTGQRWLMLAPSLQAALQQAGIGVEMMHTTSACRTFNLLQEEGRLVVAALWPPNYIAYP